MNERLIYDVGMHTGRDTEFYLKKGFDVVGIEANPSLVDSARTKFKDYLENGQLIICNCAVADREGEIDFYVNDQHDDWGTISSSFAARNEKLGTNNSTIKVKSQPFSTIVKEHGIPYYVKIDIEGADTLCLKDLQTFEEKPKYVSIEAGLISFEETFTELSLLWNLGYRSFKIVNQAKNETVVCPNPPLEGLFVNYVFDSTCSGLFGEESPGVWMDVEQTLSKYRGLISEQKWFGANGKFHKTLLHKAYHALKREPVGWYDIHAKLES
jgi:FkbM family methyltransferase